MNILKPIRSLILLKNPFKRTLFQFCQPTNGILSQKETIQDWKYCKLISEDLKSNNVNGALSLLFQSYFDKQILDMQIYNKIFQKLNELSMTLSYFQILYEVYREQFPPHLLMKNWMDKLATSKNQKTIELLKKDYDAINESFPETVKTKSKRQLRKQQRQRFKQQPGIKQDGKDKEIPFPAIKASPNIQIPNISADEMKSKYANEIKEVLEQFNIDLKGYSRIILQNVEIQLNNDLRQQNQEFEEDEELPEQYDYDNQTGPDLRLLGLDISKIKIGKIQLHTDKDKEQ